MFLTEIRLISRATGFYSNSVGIELYSSNSAISNKMSREKNEILPTGNPKNRLTNPEFGRKNRALSLYLFGCLIWLSALFLPAAEVQDSESKSTLLSGWTCLKGTFIWFLWFGNPLIFVPLLFVNIWTILSPLFFYAGTKKALPAFVLPASILCIPVAAGASALLLPLRAGFYVWVGSLIAFALAFAALKNQCN